MIRGVVLGVLCLAVLAWFAFSMLNYYQRSPAASLRELHVPHIVFIVADDLGWNDVSWNNPNTHTPNLEKWAKEGIILNSSYVQPVCSPSRSAFMTGYYPFHTGIQHGVINNGKPYGVPLRFRFLPQELRRAGYSTHIVGKWHLGYCKWEYTPTHRGFNNFYGFFGACEDYFTHSADDGLDLWDNETPDKSQNGTYSVDIFTEKEVNIIEMHDPNRPLFLYLPFQSVHGPLQVSQQYLKHFMHIKDTRRRTYSAMVRAMDDGIGRVTTALVRAGLADNMFLIFTTDNGGESRSGSGNWPLRGAKASIWEGGTRGPAFVWSTLLRKSRYVSNRLVHAVDWFPTILTLAGLNPGEDLDGVNQWPTLNDDKPTRTEFVCNIDEIFGSAAIRVGYYKLVEGCAGKFDGWHASPWTRPFVPRWKQYLEKVEREKGLNRLYNIKDDPTEQDDLASRMPDIVMKMKKRLTEYRRSLFPAFKMKEDPKADPANWDGVWAPGWC